MISYKKSRNILKKSKIKIDYEILKTDSCINRVSAENIFSKVNNPAANNAAFDGYVINSKDTKNLNKKKNKLFKILGTIAAGDKSINKKFKKFQTFEIMTGSIIPKGFDTIIPVEQAVFYPNKKKPEYIVIDKKIKKHQHIRFKGSDFKKNDLLVKKGTILQSGHILAFKSLGVNSIKVKKKPNILFFSTGNEISNSKIDIILTSGAVSAGKFDFIPSVVKKFKLSNYFKGVQIRPGKPILFAKLKSKNKVIFGLPGNPISSAACFRFFVYPYLQEILEISEEKPLKAILKNQFIKKKNFTRFVKSKFNTTKNGKIETEILKGQESFRIQSFVKSNIWTLLPSGKSKFKKGDIVDCYFPNHSQKVLI